MYLYYASIKQFELMRVHVQYRMGTVLIFLVGFGFTQEAFVGIEQTYYHAVEVGFLSGFLLGSVIFTVTIELDTAAGKLHDYSIVFN